MQHACRLKTGGRSIPASVRLLCNLAEKELCVWVRYGAEVGDYSGAVGGDGEQLKW